MQYYHASIEQLKKILEVRSCDRTPDLLITLDDTDMSKLSATLVQINKLINDTTRYVSNIAFINKSGERFNHTDKTINMKIYGIMQTLKQKYDVQISIEKNVKLAPIGPYSDFFRSKDMLHNKFGNEFPASEIQDLILAPEGTDETINHMFVDVKTDTITSYTSYTL